MLDEMLLVVVELLPVLHVLSQIDLVNGPEALHLVLVHLPNVVILDREKHKSTGIFLKQRLWERSLNDSLLSLTLVLTVALGILRLRGLSPKQVGSWVGSMDHELLRGVQELRVALVLSLRRVGELLSLVGLGLVLHHLLLGKQVSLGKHDAFHVS